MKLILLLLLLVVFSDTVSAQTPEIKLCYEDSTVFPWITAQEEGLAFTELKIVESKLKLKFKYIRLPWKRCQYEAEAGLVDGLIAASFNKERARWGMYPTLKNEGITLDADLRMHTDSFWVYVRRDSGITFKNGEFQNLKDNQIGVQLGYSIGSDLKDKGYNIQSTFNTPYDLLKQLDMNSLKVAVLQNYQAINTMKENPTFSKSIERLDEPFKIKDQYVLLTKKFYDKNQSSSQSIWQAVGQARKSLAYKNAEKMMLEKK